MLQDRGWLWEQGFGRTPENLGSAELVLVH